MNKLVLIAINTLRGFSSPVFNFLIAIFGIKYFGKEDWGTLINVLLWVFLILFVINWGNKEYLIRKYSAQPSKMYHAFYSNFFSRSLLLPLALLLFLYFPLETATLGMLLVIIMHLYQTLDSLVVYQQKFAAQFIAETLAFFIVFSSIFYLENFNLETFLKLYCIAYTCKFTYLVTALKLWKERFSFQLSLTEFKASFWFFMMGLSGWLVSKIDIYIVDFYLPKPKLSEYQLLITSFLMLQAISGFVTMPFMKNLYRLPKRSVTQIKKNLSFAGIPITIMGGLAIWCILEKLVQLNVPFHIYLLGTLSALPSFFYIIDIIALYKQHQEKKVIIINFIGVFFNFVSIAFLIKTHQITGVFIGVCITQWILLIIYKTYGKYSLSSL